MSDLASQNNRNNFGGTKISLANTRPPVHIAHIQQAHLNQIGTMVLLNLTDLSEEPLHSQMSRQIRAQILAGHLAPTAAMPSIRAMARDQRVSVITVQRAYDDLEREGLLISRRGKGFFVAELPTGQRQERALQKAGESLTKALKDARADGLSAKQIRTLVDNILKDGVDQ